MFANVYLEIEAMVMKEVHSITGLEEDWLSLYGLDINLIKKEIEIIGYDRFKGEEFTMFYDYAFKKGKIQYNNGIIEIFEG